MLLDPDFAWDRMVGSCTVSKLDVPVFVGVLVDGGSLFPVGFGPVEDDTLGSESRKMMKCCW